MLVLLTLFGLYLLSSRMSDLERAERVDEGRADGGRADEGEGTHLFNRLVRLHHRVPVLTVLMDMALVAIAYFGAYLVRWDTEQLPAELAYFRQTLTMVIFLKLMGLAAAGVYAPRFRHYSLADVWGTVRANILGSLLAASVLLLVFRVGLSRGMLIVDFLLCATLTIVGRVSFRFLADIKEKWSTQVAPAAFVGRIEDAELAFQALREVEEPRLRPVAVVDHTYGGRRGRFKGYPLFGGDAGLERAVRECGVNTVVVMDRGGVDKDDKQRVGEYLMSQGALDVFAVRISVGLIAVEVGAGRT